MWTGFLPGLRLGLEAKPESEWGTVECPAIELWFDRQGMPDWFLVTKLPMLDRRGPPQGVMGFLRRPAEHERRLPIFQTVARAVDLLRRDHAKPLNIADVAKACGQSLRQLQRRFQTAFGISPQEFLMKTRVLAACRSLHGSDLSAREVALRCGFVDHSSFTQHFRKRTARTPAAYRRARGAVRNRRVSRHEPQARQVIPCVGPLLR